MDIQELWCVHTGSIVLSHLKWDIKELKKIQREATEMISEKKELPYDKKNQKTLFLESER